MYLSILLIFSVMLSFFNIEKAFAEQSNSQTGAEIKKIQDQLEKLEGQRLTWLKIEKETSDFVTKTQKECLSNNVTSNAMLKCQDGSEVHLQAYSEYGKRLQAAKDELRKVDFQVKTLKSQLPKDTVQAMSAQMDLSDASSLARFLMSDINLVQTQLATNKATLQNVRQQLDNTLLGNYVKYALDRQLSSPSVKKSICQTISSCEQLSSSKMKTQEQLQTFQQHLEQLKREMRSRGDSAPAAGSSGSSSSAPAAGSSGSSSSAPAAKQ